MALLKDCKIIFLDQNKWIDLLHSSDGGPLNGLLNKLHDAVLSGKVACPINSQHIIECQKLSDSSYRTSLATLMADLSQGWVYAEDYFLEKKEFEYSVMSFLGLGNLQKPDPIGRGIPYATGYDLDAFCLLLKKPKWFCEILLLELEKRDNLILQISGSNNLASKKFMKSMEKIVIDEEGFRDLSNTFHPSIQRRNLIGKYLIERKNMIDGIMRKHNLSIDNFIDLGKKGMSQVLENAPTMITYIELTVDTYTDSKRPLRPNDFIDFSSLRVAIPYSDIVVCEKYLASIARQRKLDKRYTTKILSSLSDLEMLLSSLN